jgi:hypothetical protein
MTEKSFVKQLEKIFIKEGFLTKREVGVGYGVADLVLARLDSKKCAVRVRNKQFKPLLREDFFKIFYHLPEDHKSPVSLNYLIKKTNLSESFLKYSILKKLEKDGYVKRTEKNLYFKVNGWIPMAKELIAIEAKMKDWRRGFLQANRYKSFANKVYLAIPSKIEHLVDKKLLKKHGVGLIVLNTDTNKKKVLSVKTIKPLNHFQNNFASEFFLTRKNLNNSTTF